MTIEHIKSTPKDPEYSEGGVFAPDRIRKMWTACVDTAEYNNMVVVHGKTKEHVCSVREKILRSLNDNIEPHDKTLDEVEAECDRQIKKWGGLEYDMQRTPQFWTQLIQDYAGWARVMSGMGSSDKYRERIINIAAICVSAVRALDERVKLLASEKRANK